MTAALEGGEWLAARPGCTLPPEKTRYQFYRTLGGPQGQSGRAENLVPTGIQSRTVQPIVAIPTELPSPHLYVNYLILIRCKFGLQKEVKAFLSLALGHGGRMAHRQPRVFPVVLVVWCWVSCHFRRVLRIAKSYYQLLHVCTSVRMEQLGHSLD